MRKNTVTQKTTAEALQVVAKTYRKKYIELLSKVHGYYHEELILRGDRTQMREYKEYFGIE